MNQVEIVVFAIEVVLSGTASAILDVPSGTLAVMGGKVQTASSSVLLVSP